MHRVITHYRVPQNLYEGQKRGKPGAAFLFPYRRGEGFVGLSDTAPPTSRGGMTFCDVYEGETLVVSGCARCSYADNFSYRNGRLIAEGRAEKKLESRVTPEQVQAALTDLSKMEW